MNPMRWGLAAVAVCLFAGPADAALCVKRSGAVVARATCKQKETVLTADVFSGSPGPAGAAGPKGDKGDKGEAAGFKVVDASGRQVALVDFYSDTTVAVAGAILNVSVAPEGFGLNHDEPTLYHDGANCTGPAFLWRYPGDGFVQYPGIFESTAYYAADPIAEHTFNSFEAPAETCQTAYTPRGFCCTNLSSPYAGSAGRVQTFDLSTLGTPPFSLVP
jgi:hypothetical protein